jgi:hypothetical protein
MQWLLTLLSLVAYIGGLILLIKVTPGLNKRAYDDMLFIPIAAGTIFGAMLAFGAIGVTFATFGGNTPVRVADALFLVIFLIIALRTAFRSFRPNYYLGADTYKVSRMLAGSFCLLLAAVTVYILVLIFQIA